MSRTINKVTLLGRVGTDPEMQYTPGGAAVTKLRLATDRYRKDAENETDWHDVVCWRQHRRGGEPVRRQGPAHLRRGPPRPELLGRRRRPAPPPHRDSRLRGRVPRLQGRERHRRRLGHRAAGRRLSLLVPQPHSDAFSKARHGAASIYRGRPRSCSNRYARRPT